VCSSDLQCPRAFNIYVNTESTFENANQNDNPLHGIADGLSHRGHEAEDLESKLVVGVEIPARHEEGGRELELKKKKEGKSSGKVSALAYSRDTSLLTRHQPAQEIPAYS
jgi:hypothetical protein